MIDRKKDAKYRRSPHRSVRRHWNVSATFPQADFVSADVVLRSEWREGQGVNCKKSEINFLDTPDPLEILR
jgi:hypothetical protein